MKLTQQVNPKISYILLALVGGLMLIMIVWYVLGGTPPEQTSGPVVAQDVAQEETAGQEQLSDSVRGTVPDASAVEQKLASQAGEAPAGQEEAAQDVAASDTPLASEPSTEAVPDEPAQQAEDAAEAEGTAATETAASEEAADAVQQGADAAAASNDAAEQAAKEAELIAAQESAKKAAQEAAAKAAAAEESQKIAARSAAKAERQTARHSGRKNKLTAINVVPTQYGVVIRLQTAAPVDDTRWDRLRSPNRVYVDLFGQFRSGVSDQDIPDNPYVKRLRIGLHKDMIRVVADLASASLPHSVKVSKGAARVVVLELSDFR